MRDLHNRIQVARAISPVSVADNTAQVGQIIDNQGFDSLEYVIALGSIADADATFAVTMEEGDDPALADTAAVAAGDLLGTYAGAGFQFDSDNGTRKLGYKGTKRYTRITITPSANSSAALMSVLAIQSNANQQPTS